MAVAHDAVSESHTGTTGSASQASFSWTHTPAGTPRGVVVFTFVNAGAADDATAVTYGGVSMAAVSGGRAVNAGAEPGDCKTWFLGSSIPTGAQSVVVTRTNNANVMYAVAVTQTAAADTATVGTPILVQADSTLAEQNVDSGADTALRYAGSNDGSNAIPGVGANSSNLGGSASIDFGTRTARVVVETTAGSGSRPVGFSSAGTESRAAVHLAVAESAASTQNLTGTLFTAAPTFNVGTITSVGGLSGVLFAKTPTFPTGLISTPLALTGTLFSKAPTFPVGVVSVASGVAMSTQYGRPDETLDAAGWGTAPLFSKLQTFPWDGVQAGGLFIDSPNNPTGLDSQSVKFGLNTLTDPGTNKGHRLRVTWYRNGTSTMRGDVELRQGTTLIAALTNTNITADSTVDPFEMFDSYLLTEVEAAAITDYSDLRIWIRPNRTSGATSTDIRVRGVELEVPGDDLSRLLPSGVPSDPWMHLNADALDMADGASIGSWQDDSGNGNSLLGRTGSEPTFKAAISEFNNLPAVRFDGVNDRLAQALNEVVEDFTFVVHLVPRSFQDSRGVGFRTPCIFSGEANFAPTGHKTLLAMVDETITVQPCATLDIPDWMITQTGANHVTGGTPELGDEFVIVVRFKTGADEIWENGVRVAQCDASSNSNLALQIGCREDNTRHTEMDLRRFLFYDRNLTDQEITDLTVGLLNESASVSQTPNATTSNDGWDTAPLAGQSIHTYIATDDSDYITVTVP